MRPFSTPAGAEALVVLGSSVSPAQFERPYPTPDPETAERCRHAAWIYGKVRLPVLVSGAQVAVTMREMLLGEGVADEMIWTEYRSRSTHENASLSAQILRRHGVRRIVLVVDARSMFRAAACFRREGIEVVAAPSRFRYISANVDDWLPGWKAVQGNEITLHETLALLWYRLRGWI
ncbi:MAG: YdcF family protein [Candidatus Solibacter sp.]